MPRSSEFPLGSAKGGTRGENTNHGRQTSSRFRRAYLSSALVSFEGGPKKPQGRVGPGGAHPARRAAGHDGAGLDALVGVPSSKAAILVHELHDAEARLPTTWRIPTTSNLFIPRMMHARNAPHLFTLTLLRRPRNVYPVNGHPEA